MPFANGAPSGPWEVFADNFAGVDPIPNTSDAAARPMGLAQGPDGSLYVSDSVKGRIWRIMFKGDRGAFGSAQLARMEARKTGQAHLRTPARAERRARTRGARRGREAVRDLLCRLPPAATAGATGRASRRSPSTRWVSGDPNRLIGIVLNGLQGEIQVEGQTFNGVMPPNAFLTDEQVAQLADVSAPELRQLRRRRQAGRGGGGAGAPACSTDPAIRAGARSSALSILNQSGPSPHGPVIANVMPGVWMLVNSQRPSGL